MAHKILKTLPKQSFDYHSRKCVICRHPDRAAIEEEFVHWGSAWDIARIYHLGDFRSVYRHAHATGLTLRRRENLHSVLDIFLEKARGAHMSGDSILRAIRAYSCVDSLGRWVDPPTQMNYSIATVPGAPVTFTPPVTPAPHAISAQHATSVEHAQPAMRAEHAHAANSTSHRSTVIDLDLNEEAYVDEEVGLDEDDDADEEVDLNVELVEADENDDPDVVVEDDESLEADESDVVNENNHKPCADGESAPKNVAVRKTRPAAKSKPAPAPALANNTKRGPASAHHAAGQAALQADGKSALENVAVLEADADGKSAPENVESDVIVEDDERVEADENDESDQNEDVNENNHKPCADGKSAPENVPVPAPACHTRREPAPAHHAAGQAAPQADSKSARENVAVLEADSEAEFELQLDDDSDHKPCADGKSALENVAVLEADELNENDELNQNENVNENNHEPCADGESALENVPAHASNAGRESAPAHHAAGQAALQADGKSALENVAVRKTRPAAKSKPAPAPALANNTKRGPATAHHAAGQAAPQADSKSARENVAALKADGESARENDPAVTTPPPMFGVLTDAGQINGGAIRMACIPLKTNDGNPFKSTVKTTFRPVHFARRNRRRK